MFPFFYRPEADDVKAMQQQLSSLHVVMEQSSNESDKQQETIRHEKQIIEHDKLRYITCTCTCIYTCNVPVYSGTSPTGSLNHLYNPAGFVE